MYKSLFGVTIILFIVCACNNTNQPKDQGAINAQDTTDSSDNKSTKLLQIEIPKVDSTFDKKVAFIAGIKVDSKLNQDSIWNKYASWMDSSWALAFKRRYNVMQKWAKSEEIAPLNNNNTLFYPFSGADFLNAHTLFPQYKNYILVGLEPVGALPKLNMDSLPYSYLEDVNTSLKDILNSSFFHTKRMKVHFHKEKVNGALPIISIFIKRTGHFIVNIEAIQLATDGKLITYPYDSLESNTFIPNGAKVTFKHPEDTVLSNVFFFSQDLSNGGIGTKNGFRLYLDSLSNYFTFVKSASYLMHYGHFSIIRSSILNNSHGLFQDDTGIPYKHLLDLNWDVKLYGKYAKPVKLFPSYKFSQNDLKLAYQNDSTIKNLPFALGYHTHPNMTSLILAQRKTTK